jgi:hypothetical protein
MNEGITGYVNDTEVRIHGGMKVKHALIALDTELYEACRHGRVTVRDGNGFVVGLDGTLEEGFRLFTREAPV